MGKLNELIKFWDFCYLGFSEKDYKGLWYEIGVWWVCV